MADDYLEFCAGVRRLAGIDLRSYKRGQMERRIRSYAQRQRAASLPEFLHRLETSPEWLEGFLDRITINVSELFRNPEQYELLRTRVLLGLRGRGLVRAWSAGCSYGAEAYTLACLLADDLGPRARFEITGSDVDRRVLERARLGVFSAEDMRHVPTRVRERYFEPHDEGARAAATLARHLRFRHEDLLTTRCSTGWDLILCRNVVIYFTDEARSRIHAALAQALRPGGHLMIGATERVAEPRTLGLEPIHPFLYRKRA